MTGTLVGGMGPNSVQTIDTYSHGIASYKGLSTPVDRHCIINIITMSGFASRSRTQPARTQRVDVAPPMQAADVRVLVNAHQPFWIAQLVACDGIHLHALVKLVAFGTHHDRDVVGVCTHGHHGTANPAHHRSCTDDENSTHLEDIVHIPLDRTAAAPTYTLVTSRMMYASPLVKQ